MDLEKAVAHMDPKVLSNGQVRIRCPYFENHRDGSGEASMFLSPDINAFHCFSCKAKGRLTRLLTTKFDVPFFDAVEMVHLDRSYVKEKKGFELNDMWSIEPPKYFLERGYTEKTLKHFMVGTNEDGHICIPVMVDGVMKGIVYQDRKGKTKRVWHSEHLDKSQILYNYNKDYNYAIIVEGPTDTWSIYQKRYNAFGVLGSYLSAEQADMLKDFDIVYAMGDNDLAGVSFNEYVYQRLKNHTEVRFLPYTAEDPGEITKRELDKAFRNSVDYLTYAMEMSELESYPAIQQKVIKSIKDEA